MKATLFSVGLVAIACAIAAAYSGKTPRLLALTGVSAQRAESGLIETSERPLAREDVNPLVEPERAVPHGDKNSEDEMLSSLLGRTYMLGEIQEAKRLYAEGRAWAYEQWQMEAKTISEEQGALVLTRAELNARLRHMSGSNGGGRFSSLLYDVKTLETEEGLDLEMVSYVELEEESGHWLFAVFSELQELRKYLHAHPSSDRSNIQEPSK